MDKCNKIEELLTAPCQVIDILPQRVKKDGKGQYFAIEEYFLQPKELRRFYLKFADILLKLNCYYDFQWWGSFHESI